MKKLLITLSLFIGLGTAFGQTLLVTTTLSAAVSNSRTTQIPLTATTGLTAGSSAIYVDQELMFINTIPSVGTTVSVTRGYGGTRGEPHASGAGVFLVPTAAVGTALASVDPQGSCTRINVQYLPIINTRTGVKSDCLGGYWIGGVGSAPNFRFLTPDPGGTAYLSINTNGTTLAATTMYCMEVDLTGNKLVTGIGILNGTTVGTDNHLVALYDSSGNLLANSAVAGVLAASASTYQTIALTAPYYAIGPAQYFACMQTNGTTATVRMAVTGTQDTYLTKGVTSITFGTVPATFTAPTTFTTAVGPYVSLY